MIPRRFRKLNVFEARAFFLSGKSKMFHFSGNKRALYSYMHCRKKLEFVDTYIKCFYVFDRLCNILSRSRFSKVISCVRGGQFFFSSALLGPRKSTHF
jgi:hypothetical protein